MMCSRRHARGLSLAALCSVALASCGGGTSGIDGICGSAASIGPDDTPPTTDLCYLGIASAVTLDGPFVWTCAGVYGGSTASCYVNVRGQCGTANGVLATSAPTTDLCITGTATAVTGTGPWAWSCVGSTEGFGVRQYGTSTESCGTLSTTDEPGIAMAYGYDTNTFSTKAFGTTNVDTGLTYASGYQWYAFSCNGTTPTQANNTLNMDGSISVGQGGNTYNANLSSVGCTSGTSFVGTAFGGGFYVEATLKFTAVLDSALAMSSGWPSFWTSAVEPLVKLPALQWPGQPTGYEHYFEGDILEFMQGADNNPANDFTVTSRDWYGTTPTSYSTGITVSEADATFFSSYHTYGMLWVPATAAAVGTLEYFLDGALMRDDSENGAIAFYAPWTTQPPPPSASTPWTYGVVDQDHLVLLFGSNSTYPITIQSVNVWQASASQNLTH